METKLFCVIFKIKEQEPFGSHPTYILDPVIIEYIQRISSDMQMNWLRYHILVFVGMPLSLVFRLINW